MRIFAASMRPRRTREVIAESCPWASNNLATSACINSGSDGTFRRRPAKTLRVKVPMDCSQRTLVKHREWFLGHAGVCLRRRSRQGQVHLARPAAEEFGPARVDASDDLLHILRRGLEIVLQETRRGDRSGLARGVPSREHAFEKTRRRVERQRPGIALAGNPML